MRTAPPGPVMLDVHGLELDAEDRELLNHPSVGGLILFARNFHDARQLAALTDAIHSVRRPPLLIAVDHEGGRVQRFKSDGFTHLPSMHTLGSRYEADAGGALADARAAGYVLAAELRALGVDLSFTPVLDLDYGRSGVIGDRAFHLDPAIVAPLAGALAEGLRAAGMKSVGKHFPGHGWAEADSHVAIPVDERDFDTIWALDIRPYLDLGRQIDAVMPAHVIYPAVDRMPAGFSRTWVQDILRGKLAFDGVVFSDDLSMEGASVAGDVVARAEAAWDAGCDMVLVCNARDQAVKLIDGWRPEFDSVRSARVASLMPARPYGDRSVLAQDARYRDALDAVRSLLA
ncbi:beta-N-acetylhexosaminidase [Methyloversatilis thermotolerans]|uniref:beta-N-acetylhexosaminidase n=1 Tax=Methyloversatilis thermotolerans TaxID=1346290 RepID=UPI00039EF6E8|nr:beta-N-acetylhexosaminidase [Methyloversatilis thermotolerans]